MLVVPLPTYPVVAVSVAYDAGPSHLAGHKGYVAQLTSRWLQDTVDGQAHRIGINLGTRVAVNADTVTFTTVDIPAKLHAILWLEAERLRLAQHGPSPRVPIPTPLRTDPIDSLSVFDFAVHRATRWVYQGMNAYENLPRLGQLPVPHAVRQPAPPGQAQPKTSGDNLSRQVSQYAARYFVTPVIVVAGRVHVKMVKSWLTKLLSTPPHHAPSNAPRRLGSLPEQLNQRSDITQVPSLSAAWFTYAWAGPTASNSADVTAVQMSLTLLQQRLTSTASSTPSCLPQEATVGTLLDLRRGPSLATLTVRNIPPSQFDEARQCVNEQLHRLAGHGPSAREMKRGWTHRLRLSMSRWTCPAKLAPYLARMTIIRSGPQLKAKSSWQAILRVNRRQIIDATFRYLRPRRRTLIALRSPPTRRVIPQRLGPKHDGPSASAEPKRKRVPQGSRPHSKSHTRRKSHHRPTRKHHVLGRHTRQRSSTRHGKTTR